MPDNLLYILVNVSFYKWSGSIINRLFKRKIGLGSNEFINFTNNLEAFLCIRARAIILLPIYTKGLFKVL